MSGERSVAKVDAVAPDDNFAGERSVVELGLVAYAFAIDRNSIRDKSTFGGSVDRVGVVAPDGNLCVG